MSFYGLLAISMLSSAAIMTYAFMNEAGGALGTVHAYQKSAAIIRMLAIAESAGHVPQQYMGFVYARQNIEVIEENRSLLIEDPIEGIAIAKAS